LSCSSIRVSTSGSRQGLQLPSGFIYFAGIWRPPTREWPAAYTIITIESNRDIAPYHDREMTVLCRDERMAWLDMSRPACDLLHTLPPGSFRVSRAFTAVVRSLRSRFDSVAAPHRPGR
jgi:putative SOS response-associated peptidase YedK